MHYLSTAVTILAISIVLRFLLASGRRAPERCREGALVLRYPGFVAVVGWVAIGFGALIAAVTVFRLVPMTGEEAVPYLVLGFVLLGLPLVLPGIAVRITVTEEAVRSSGLRKGTREIPWAEVERVTFSWTSELVLHSGRARIRLNTLLSGFDGFLEVMKRKLDPALCEQALERCTVALRRMGRG